MIAFQMHEGSNETNISYWLLAKQMIRQDMVAAMFCLGITEETARLVVRLSDAQLLKFPAELYGETVSSRRLFGPN